MYRDIRDPQAIGEAILHAHDSSPSEPVTKVADKCLAPGTAHKNYDESNHQFDQRLHAASKRNGQISMFRAA